MTPQEQQTVDTIRRQQEELRLEQSRLQALMSGQSQANTTFGELHAQHNVRLAGHDTALAEQGDVLARVQIAARDAMQAGINNTEHIATLAGRVNAHEPRIAALERAPGDVVAAAAEEFFRDNDRVTASLVAATTPAIAAVDARLTAATGALGGEINEVRTTATAAQTAAAAAQARADAAHALAQQGGNGGGGNAFAIGILAILGFAVFGIMGRKIFAQTPYPQLIAFMAAIIGAMIGTVMGMAVPSRAQAPAAPAVPAPAATVPAPATQPAPAQRRSIWRGIRGWYTQPATQPAATPAVVAVPAQPAAPAAPITAPGTPAPAPALVPVP